MISLKNTMQSFKRCKIWIIRPNKTHPTLNFLSTLKKKKITFKTLPNSWDSLAVLKEVKLTPPPPPTKKKLLT